MTSSTPDLAMPLGRLQRHDPRSLAFPTPAAAPRTVRWRHHGPVLDQGHWFNPYLQQEVSLGSCTGNALAQLLNTAPFHKPRTKYRTEDDAVLRYYSPGTQRDPFPGWYDPQANADDTGSSGLGVCQAAKAAGDIAGYTHAFGLDHALGALANGPVLFGTIWTENGMFKPDSNGFVHPSGSVVGGHEYLVFGANLRGQYLWALNSWGARWGLSGRFKIGFTDAATLLDQGGDVTQPVL